MGKQAYGLGLLFVEVEFLVSIFGRINIWVGRNSMGAIFPF